MEELGLVKPINTVTKALVLNFDPSLGKETADVTSRLRSAGISTELYFDADKMKKQLKYADRLGIRFALIIGSQEAAEGCAMVKDLAAGSQEKIPMDAIAGYIVDRLKQ